MPREQEQLYKSLDDICTYLVEGEAWHLKAANECRKIAIRGWGRWHNVESCGDKKCLDSLLKLLRDKLEFVPNINTQRLDKANKFKMSGLEDFHEHHLEWIEREERFIRAINFAVSKSGQVDMDLYQELCKLVKEVQNETMRVKLAYDRLDFAEWMPHDIAVCSKWIHDYFEKEHKQGDPIDFNIG